MPIFRVVCWKLCSSFNLGRGWVCGGRLDLIVGEFSSVGIGEGLTARSSYSFPGKEEIFGRLFWVRSFQTRVILCCNYSRFYFEKFSPQASLYVCYSWMVSLKGNSMCDTIVLFLPIDCEQSPRLLTDSFSWCALSALSASNFQVWPIPAIVLARQTIHLPRRLWPHNRWRSQP